MTKVLIVDDEPAVLRSTSLLLAGIGYEVVTTSDAQAVVETVRRERPDAVLQDVRMPGLDLEAVVDALQRDPEVRHTALVLFSASMDLPEIQARVRADGILEKPFSPEEVVDVLRTAVEEARGRTALVGRSLT